MMVKLAKNFMQSTNLIKILTFFQENFKKNQKILKRISKNSKSEQVHFFVLTNKAYSCKISVISFYLDGLKQSFDIFARKIPNF
jgi:hypothetical protein